MRQLGHDAMWTYDDETDMFVFDESTPEANDGLTISLAVVNYARYIREVCSCATYSLPVSR